MTLEIEHDIGLFCLGPECARPIYAKGLCEAHYAQKRKHPDRELRPLQQKLTSDQAVAFMLNRGFKPYGPFPGVTRPWPGECLAHGHKGKPRLIDVRNRNQGSCNECGIKETANKNRLDSSEAISVMKEKGYEPLEAFTDTKTPWRCRHECGDIVSPSYSNVAQGFGGCDRCGQAAKAQKQRKPKAGMTLKEVFPHVAAEAHGWDPKTSTPSSGDAREWKCSTPGCGHVWTATVNSRTANGSGCSRCAKHGIDYGAPGFFYVVTGDDYVKCGIANANRIDSRLKDHRRSQFNLQNVLARVFFEVTRDAADLERKWRDFVVESPYRVGNTKEYVLFHDDAVSFALALAACK